MNAMRCHRGWNVSRSGRQFSLILAMTFGVAAAVILCAASLHAHEIGTTQVAVQFHPTGSYQIEITTDAEALVEKLVSVAGESLGEPGSSATLQAQLQKYDELFRRRLSIEFDGAAGERPSIEYFVPEQPDSPPTALIKLTGMVPGGARQFTWTYSWTFATYALTVRQAGAAQPDTEWLEGGQPSSLVSLGAPAPQAGPLGTAVRYLALGFTHIVPKGLDHILFVLGIFLLSRGMKQVLLQVTAFTIAHSITLALSMYGIVTVSPTIVEPLIAVSIAYVALENMLTSELRPWRLALVFAFGLLHGMGFAGALKELELPRSEFVTALLSFNLGVEAGQLAVIAAAFLLLGWYCGSRPWYRRRVVLPASALIACAAVYWTIERLSI